ncbi:NUDIX domain-containing protein [Streptomyces rubiginosohelvolus]|uniref:NUDIX domain-containing protein n=1 Tax=Streptomyces rubiginosohelvolus TaxID=67362 RepID=UPI003694FFA6
MKGPRAAAAVGVHLYLQDANGRVLLGLRHPDSVYAGRLWHTLAGHCEREDAVSSLIRETEEEAGLLLDREAIDPVHLVHSQDSPSASPRVQLFFRARSWSGVPQVRDRTGARNGSGSTPRTCRTTPCRTPDRRSRRSWRADRTPAWGGPDDAYAHHEPLHRDGTGPGARGAGRDHGRGMSVDGRAPGGSLPAPAWSRS